MKKIIVIVLTIILAACNNTSQKNEEHKQDSIAATADKKVDRIIQNDDSLIKAKEKELLEKYK